MIVFKYNEDKETYTLKGLTYEHLRALNGLMEHVVLGQQGAPGAIGDILVAMEKEEFDVCEVSVKIDRDGYFSILLE